VFHTHFTKTELLHVNYVVITWPYIPKHTMHIWIPIDHEYGWLNSVQWLGYELEDRGSIRGRGRFFCFRHRVQTGSGPHPASYPTSTGDYFPGVKRPGREAEHSPPSSAEVKNEWSCTSTPYVFLTWCLVQHRDNFVFTLLNLRAHTKITRRPKMWSNRTRETEC
jgi:hypothetical protein